MSFNVEKSYSHVNVWMHLPGDHPSLYTTLRLADVAGPVRSALDDATRDPRERLGNLVGGLHTPSASQYGRLDGIVDAVFAIPLVADTIAAGTPISEALLFERLAAMTPRQPVSVGAALAGMSLKPGTVFPFPRCERTNSYYSDLPLDEDDDDRLEKSVTLLAEIWSPENRMHLDNCEVHMQLWESNFDPRRNRSFDVWEIGPEYIAGVPVPLPITGDTDAETARALIAPQLADAPLPPEMAFFFDNSVNYGPIPPACMIYLFLDGSDPEPLMLSFIMKHISTIRAAGLAAVASNHFRDALEPGDAILRITVIDDDDGPDDDVDYGLPESADLFVKKLVSARDAPHFACLVGPLDGGEAAAFVDLSVGARSPRWTATVTDGRAAHETRAG